MSMNPRVCSLGELVAIYGEERLDKYLRTFSCPLNSEVEDFLWNKALTSLKLSASQTYLVIDDETNLIVGYYTLVLKAYTVSGARLSSANRRLISRFAEEDAAGNFHAAVYLIAQIGKNFANGSQIEGDSLLGLALDEFRAVKARIGGKLVMVERESDRPKLFSFYTKNGFKSWTSRTNEKDGMVYDQMFAVLNGKPQTGGNDIGS